MPLATEQLLTVKEWLLAKNEDIDDIEMDIDLIENRILSSLEFMNFVFFLEELVERDLAEEAGSIDSFRTLNQIQLHILQHST